ncbi:MAG TPA: hypothetical protein VJT84_06505 [Gaiellaceae bacterium]|nr:hypothetical protein [Gaiellaceae bacterium]
MISARRAAGAALVVLALAGCGNTDQQTRIERSLRGHLAERSLPAKSVHCVPSAWPTYRCNVNFGDPHVQIYCAELVDGVLRAAEWRQAVQGRLDRGAAARECARWLDVRRSR